MEDKIALQAKLKHPIFKEISRIADEKGIEAYVIGGYVRDLILGRPSKDIDIVVLGSGIDLAQEAAKQLGNLNVSVFKTFGTAMFRYKGVEIEFVGARKESYNFNSRKPTVEEGTIEDDQRRRDFTINAMAIALNGNRYGELVDPFGGMAHLEERTIKTPLDPGITFSDDPLRMMRAIRFATQLDFNIEAETLEALSAYATRLPIISMERIMDEFNKIMLAPKPSKGIILLEKTGLLEIFFPELTAMKGVDAKEGIRHKDNFYHTLQVLDNLATVSNDLWLRWSALLHDIGKPVTKRYVSGMGWTFHGHNHVGERMVGRIFNRLKLPQNEKMKYVKKMVNLHMRPIVLAEDVVTDSAVRRMLFECGDDIDDLMTLAEADITSKNEEKVKRYLSNFQLVREKLKEVEEKDSIRNFQPPVTGEEIMEVFGIEPCRAIGDLKCAIKEAILEGEIGNNHDEAFAYMIKVAAQQGLTPKQ
ncbi:MAG: CCA tRNA nucleotidyltransferase [Marinifilaceae bacterium]